jgi:hypothetical protein
LEDLLGTSALKVKGGLKEKGQQANIQKKVAAM